ISPTCRTRRTFGSALIDSMNAGVSPNSAVSVGVVPYGESPKTAIVSSSFEFGSIGVPLPATAEDDSTVRALKTLRIPFVRIDALLLAGGTVQEAAAATPKRFGVNFVIR